MKPMIRILGLLKEYYPIILIYSVCISFLVLATPISVQSLVNTFSFGPYFQPIFILSVLLLGLLVVLGVLKSLQYLMVEYLQRSLYSRVTAGIARAYFIGDEKGCLELDQKANRYFDVVLMHKNLAFLVTEGIAIALQTALGLILISFYHPFFIVFSFLILLAILGPVYLLGKKAVASAIAESTLKYQVADHIRGLAKHHDSQLVLKEKIHLVDNQIKAFLIQRSDHFKTVFLQNIAYIGLYAVLNAFLLGLGGYLVIANQLSVGQLVAAEIVVTAILSKFLKANKYLEAFYDMNAAANKLEVFFQYVEQNKPQTKSEMERSSSIYAEDIKDFLKTLTSVRMVPAPTQYKTLFRNFAISFTVIVIGIFLVPWQQFSRGEGRVLAYDPNNRIQQVTATLDGIVEEWLVQDGQFVKKGDPLVRIVDNDPNFMNRLESQRDAAVAKFEAAKEASDTGRLNFHRQEKLVKEGLSSSKEFEQAKITYKKLRAEEAVAAADLAKAETALSRQQQQDLTAPRDGQILRILKGSGTTNVKTGEALLDFVPQTEDKAVELFVDGNDLPLVFPGRKVRLQFEGWPAIQFSGWPSVAIGSFGGIVSVVDPSVSENGTFRILIKPDPEDSVSWPKQDILRQGTRVVGIVILEQVSIGYEIWRKVNGFPKSMRHSPENLKSKEKK